MSTLEPWGKANKTTIQNELANKPRYDIDGRRYGNTLTDDMISIKNPQIGNRHTPVSYDYFTTPSHLNDFAEDNAATPLTVPAAQLEQLVKMGVATNNETLGGYLKLYKYYMDNLAGK